MLKHRFWIAAKLIGFGALAATVLQAAPSLVSIGGQDEARAPAAAAQHDHSPAAPAQIAQASAPAPTVRLADVVVRRELDIPHWLPAGEYVWDAEGAPARGPTIIVVNLRARVLSVYRAGVEIGRSSLIYGADNMPTPTGTFPILQKDADHWSNLYDAPMPHMLRLTWDGVALHGSPALADDVATHGCVGLPREFAALLFDAVRVGDNVIVWDGVTAA